MKLGHAQSDPILDGALIFIGVLALIFTVGSLWLIGKEMDLEAESRKQPVQIERVETETGESK